MVEIVKIEDVDGDPEGIYSQRVTSLENIEDNSELYEQFKDKEAKWRRREIAFAVAPLATTTAFVISPVAEGLSTNYKIGGEVAALYCSIVSGIVADWFRDRQKKKAREVAAFTAQIYDGLGIVRGRWVEEALAENLPRPQPSRLGNT